jgi:GAF domain-containing protein
MTKNNTQREYGAGRVAWLPALRVTPEERAQIERLAQQAGLSLAQYRRLAELGELDKVDEKEQSNV